VSKLRVEERRGQEALEALRREWQALFHSASASPFLSWEWMGAWQRSFGQGRIPRLLCARAGERLIGLLPLAEEERWLAGLPMKVRRWSFLGERYVGADYLDVLAEPGREPEAAAAIFEHLAASGGFDVLELEGMAADSLSLPLLVRRFGDHAAYKYQLEPQAFCPQVEIAGNWEQVLAGSKRGREFYRRVRRLHAKWNFEWRVVTEPEEAVAAFNRFLVLHEKRWARQGGSDAMSSAAHRAFHRAVVEQLAPTGLLRFEEMWLDGQCCASMYGMNAGERFCFYQIGYDPAWAKQSVGFMLLGLSIQDAVNRGVKTYDFLRGSETYKFDWANCIRSTMRMRIASRSLISTLAITSEQVAAAAETAIKAVLPDRALDHIQRWRRLRRKKKESSPGAEAGATRPEIWSPAAGRQSLNSNS
jgi:CelD/BcsL family acetyltransferase involved in cellulose biosynthesis